MSSKAYYKKYWTNNLANDGHAVATPKWPKAELDMYVDFSNPFISGKVLDIGCGDGQFISYLHTRFGSSLNIMGCDISEDAVLRANKLAPYAEFCVASVDDTLSYTDATFDTIFMNDVIEHIIDVPTALSEVSRVLKPGGHLIVITPDFNLLKKLIIAALFWDTYFHPANPHIRFFTKNSFKKIAFDYCLKLVNYKWGLTWFYIMPQNSYFIFEKYK